MRPDMAKVVVERQRHRSSHRGGDRRGAKADQDFERKRAPMLGKTHNLGADWMGKDLNEHLNPVVKFLHKNVGRPWDKVHSEIAEHIRLDSAVQSHVLDHVKQMVVEDVYMIGKWPFDSQDRPVWNIGRGWYQAFYVDPKGFLRKSPSRFPGQGKAKDERGKVRIKGEWCRQVIESDELRYIELKGVWYAVTFEPSPAPGPMIFRDLLLGCPVNDSTLIAGRMLRSVFGKVTLFSQSWDRHENLRIWGQRVYAVAKRQIGKKEKKKVEAAWEKSLR